MATSSTSRTSDYKAFLSYSHAADGDLVAFVQNALQSFAKPWYQRRAIRVFRDTTGLGVTPHLWGSIQVAMQGSEYFILFASEQSARSHWVELELNEWLRIRSADRLLIVWTDGGLVWDPATKDFDWTQSSAIHPRLRGVFPEEPLYVDMRWANSSADLSLRRPELIDAVARLSATLRQIPVDDLLGEDIRQHRRTRRLAGSAIGGLIVLLVSAVAASFVALQQRNEARGRLVELIVSNGARELENSDVSAAAVWFAEALNLESNNANARNLQRVRVNAAIGSHPALLRAWFTDASLHTVLLTFGRNGRYLISEGVKEEFDAMTMQGTVSPAGGPRLWDTQADTQESLKRNLREDERLFAIDAAADSIRLLVGNKQNAVRIVETRTGAELAILNHGDEVLSAAFSPDMRLVITEAADQAVRLWNASDGHLIETLRHENPLRRTAFTADMRRVWSITTDGTVHIWTLTADHRLASHRSIAHQDPVDDVDVSKDGHYCVTVASHEARLWNLSSAGKEIHLESWSQVNHAEFSPDGSQLLLAYGFGEANVLNVSSRQIVAVAKPDGAVLHATFSSDGRRFATASTDRVARIWSANGGDPLSPPLFHEDTVNRVAFDTDQRRLATTTANGVVRVWQLDRKMDDLKHESVDDLAYTADGRHLLSVSESQAKLWDVTTFTLQASVNPGSQIFHAELSRDGRRLVTASAAKTADIWDAASGQLLLSIPHNARVQFASFREDGAWIVTAASGGGTPDVSVWDATKGTKLFSLPHSSDWVQHAEFSRDGGRVLTFASLGARVWDLSTRQEVLRVDDVRKAAFSNDGTMLATVAGADVKIYDISRAVATPPFIRHDDFQIDHISFTADSSKLLVVGGGYARLWDARTRNASTPPLRHGSRTNVIFATASDDGRFLATSAQNGTARVWFAATGQPVTPPFKYGAGLHNIAFSPDGLHLASAGGDAVRIWNLDSQGGRSDGELQLAAQVLSARKIDATGAMALLTASEFKQAWQRLRLSNQK